MSVLAASTTTEHVCPIPATRTRLLGRFLVDEGLIGPSDLEEALRLMAAVNVSLGDLATERGWITSKEASALQRLQLKIDGRWGELALRHEIGSLTPQRLEALRWEQDAHNLRLGDALVQLGSITATEMDRQVERFESLHAPVEFDLVLPPAFDGVDGAYRAVEVLPRLLRRLLAGPARLGQPAAWAGGRSLFASASVRLPTAVPIVVGLGMPRAVALDIADAFGTVVRDEAPATDADAHEAVSRVVKIWACQIIDPQGTKPENDLGLRPGTLPSGGIEFDVALAEGVASLVIDRLSS